MRATGLCQTLDPIGPIAAAAEQPGDDEPRGRHGLHIKIDREIVAELQDRSEPQTRHGRILRAEPGLGRGEQRQFRVGARQ